MKLIRLARLYLRPCPDDFVSLSISFEGCNVRILSGASSPESLVLLIIAERQIDAVSVIGPGGVVSLPEEARLTAEHAIEEFAHVLAVRDGAGWELKSPGVTFALEPESDEEREQLKSAVSAGAMIPGLGGVQPKIELQPQQLSAALQDRYDGVALLAEALSHTHASAQFHEYVRLFERAFALSSIHLVNPLSTFLSGLEHGYTEAEVQNWLIEIRHPTTHADRDTPILLEADVRPIIFRVKQAAYDVLLNKSIWHSEAPDRRNAWSPAAWTMAPDSNEVHTFEGHRPFRIENAALDEFRVFYLDLQSQVELSLPESWWTGSETRLTSNRGAPNKAYCGLRRFWGLAKWIRRLGLFLV